MAWALIMESFGNPDPWVVGGSCQFAKGFEVLFESVAVNHVMSANLNLVNVCAREDKTHRNLPSLHYMSGLLYNMDRKMKWVFSSTALLELKKAVFSCLRKQFGLVGTAHEVAKRKPEMGREEGGGRTAEEVSSSPSTAPNFPQNELNQSGENVLQLLPTPFWSFPRKDEHT